MKVLLANKIIIAVLGVVLVSGGGYFVYQAISNNSGSNNSNNSNNNSNTNNSNGDFIKTGQYSFGLDVCNEFTKEMAGQAIGKTIVKTEDYSNSGSTGCEYFVKENSFVIVDVGFGKAENQRTGLKSLGYELTTTSTIGLENFISISDTKKGEYVDVYMVVDPNLKYVRVGRSSTTVIDNATLVKLAQKVEEKIRSYK